MSIKLLMASEMVPNCANSNLHLPSGILCCSEMLALAGRELLKTRGLN